MSESSKRQNSMACRLSDNEKAIVDNYLEKYQIKNRSRWFREAVLTHIYRIKEADYPTLFDEYTMRR
ncbi:hypothetical protein EZS27_029381 [termite gut metagenome]|jgi:hypothetical protein|uniref:Ribbon-helix-helix protein CopG domain-containing protein n=1 Tax=termite gut metagenome TaxID=433724 RepID=A0A5J4QI12_9ZZZZ